MDELGSLEQAVQLKTDLLVRYYEVNEAIFQVNRQISELNDRLKHLYKMLDGLREQVGTANQSVESLQGASKNGPIDNSAPGADTG